MTDYIHNPALVADPFTFERAANAPVTVYDADDTFNAVPLVLKDLNGMPLANPITSTGDAVTPWMVTTSPQLKLVGGGLTVVVSSYKGLREDALAAQTEAQQARTAAQGAQAAAAQAAEFARAPTDAQVDAGISRANIPGQVSAVVTPMVETQLPPLIGPLVAEAIAADSTVTDAAAAAVNGELAIRSLLQSAFSDETDVELAITDEAGRRNFLEATKDGTPTTLSQQLLAQVFGLFQGLAYEGYSFVAVDAFDRAGVIAQTDDGGWPAHSVEAMRNALTPPAAKKITTIGHSFTSNGTEADYLRTALGWPSHATLGVGGEIASTIAARIGALVWELHPVGGSIPTTGPVEVQLDLEGRGIALNTAWPLLWSNVATGQNNDGLTGLRGSLAGIPGKLTITRPAGTTSGAAHLAGDQYFFTRDTAGAATPCARASFMPSFAQTAVGGVVIIHTAINGLGLPDSAESDDTFGVVQAIIDWLPHDRWLVIGEWCGATGAPGTTAGDAVMAWNRRASHRWGRRFVDINSFALTHGLATAGITPTAGDVTDIATGIVPRSLRADGLHPNGAGYSVITAATSPRVRALGWA
ncbi:hypothetical protein ARTHRO9V_130189 [Arthrobacter sp. 9V]|uniref:hypothetical protein n=1 Tax=Arthrobacter sp. 9V TaxID=2653132 RepID=UPI0012F27351|nr:hypothetical protein [Arthrobacter sp. 9V]VXB24533.1 hypothetical protein ARTHRO9V_130189 [Arthrobacter sp. 9V]